MKAHAVRYHEAGHGVVARLLSINVIEVTARPSGKYRGLTVVDRIRGQHDEADFLEREIKVLLAGSLAEVKRFPDSDWTTVQGSCAGDWFMLFATADRLVQIRGLPRPKAMNILRQYPATLEIIERLAGETQHLLDANWSAVTRVAKALHRILSLKQDALDDLIAGRPIRPIRPAHFEGSIRIIESAAS
jgi:hypothetical protein